MYPLKNLYLFSHWTFREGLQALRCEKRYRFFVGWRPGKGGDGMLEKSTVRRFQRCYVLLKKYFHFLWDFLFFVAHVINDLLDKENEKGTIHRDTY